MTSETPVLGIVVVNFGASQVLEQNVARTARADDLVVVVDNFSSSAEAGRIEAMCAERGWVALRVPLNAGFGTGANLGAERAIDLGARQLLFLNPDAWLSENDVQTLHRYVLDDPCALVAPRILTSTGEPWAVDMTDLVLRNGTMRSVRRRGSTEVVGRQVLPWMSGACLVIDRDLWVRVGGFDHDYFLYWEDVDLCHRVVAAGGRLVKAADATAFHDEGTTHRAADAGRAKSDLYYRYNIRNRMVYAAHHLSRRQRLQWVATLPSAIGSVVLQGGKRQLTRPRLWLTMAGAASDGLGRAARVRRRGTDRATVRVLQSFGPARPTTNPYIVMLGSALEEHEEIDLRRFCWRSALTARYDVVHFHWPEVLFAGRSRLRSQVKKCAFALWLVKLHVDRTPIVRTVHNLHPPEGIAPFDRFLLNSVDRMTTLRLTISRTTPLDDDQPSMLALHGHYRDWYAHVEHGDPVPGRIAFVGLVRRYKGVPQLLDAFERCPTHDLSLLIAGAPSSAELESAVQSAADRDERIVTDLSFLSDADYVRAITTAELIVLPYEFMHNSGSVLAALSLNRPVLVPDEEANLALAEEFGADWVMTYERPLEPRHLEDAARRAAELLASGRRPDLTSRDWDTAGATHLRAYRLAVAAAAR